MSDKQDDAPPSFSMVRDTFLELIREKQRQLNTQATAALELAQLRLPLEDWVQGYAMGLKRDLEAHFAVWEVEEPEALMRMCMISIRQWATGRLEEK